MRLEMLWWWRPFWFFQEILVIFFSDVLSVWSPPKGFYCSICNQEFVIFTAFRHYHLFRVESFRMDCWCAHPFQLLKVPNQYVSVPNSPRLQYIPKEYSREHFLTKLMDSWLILRGYRMIFNQCTKWNDRSIKWFFKSSFERCFPTRQAILNVSQVTVTFHGIPFQFSSRPDCNNTADVPSLNLCTALPAVTFVSDEGSTYNDPTRDLHMPCQLPRNCQCKWLLVS